MFPRRGLWDHGLIAITVPVAVIIAPFVHVYLLNVTNIQLPFSGLAKPIWVVAVGFGVALWSTVSRLDRLGCKIDSVAHLPRQLCLPAD